MKLVALLVAVAFFMSPAFAFAAPAPAPAPCTCKHIEALQQELENALYLEKFQADLSKKVKAAEDEHRELREKNPQHPLARFPVEWASELEWSQEKAKVSQPHPVVKGYKGPESIPVITGTCTNNPDLLTQLKEGVSCTEIGPIILKHEQEHIAICKQMGKEAYWARLYSEIAAEEAARYKAQAKALRALLKKVIDASTVKVSEETTLKVTAAGTEHNYKMSMPAFKLSGKSSEGKDDWELAGEGKRSTSITSLKLPGMTCTPSAKKLSSKVTATLKLDGLKMKLDQTSVTEGGTISVTCKVPGVGQGQGMGIAPPGDTGSGEVFKNAKVKLQSEFKEDVAKTSWGKAISATGVTATGTSTTKVTITCQ